MSELLLYFINHYLLYQYSLILILVAQFPYLYFKYHLQSPTIMPIFLTRHLPILFLSHFVHLIQYFKIYPYLLCFKNFTFLNFPCYFLDQYQLLHLVTKVLTKFKDYYSQFNLFVVRPIIFVHSKLEHRLHLFFMSGHPIFWQFS